MLWPLGFACMRASLHSRPGPLLQAQSSKMAYTIIRPGGLKSEAATGQGVLTEDVSVCGAIHREDVADLVAQALYSDKANNKVLSAVDSKQLFGEPQLKAFSV